MLHCVPCNLTKGKQDVRAMYFVWPYLKNEDGTDYKGPLFYTYMCTDCLIEALRNGMETPRLATERRPDDPPVPVQQVTRIPNNEPERPQVRLVVVK